MYTFFGFFFFNAFTFDLIVSIKLSNPFVILAAGFQISCCVTYGNIFYTCIIEREREREERGDL
ncbi:hypothetical protein Hanom_Chr03g00224781 [Helianthus anomalus]